MKLIDYVPMLGRRQRKSDLLADRQEILAYIQAHPRCRAFDVELECHQTATTMDGHLRTLAKAGKIERLLGWELIAR